jgi:hypothetical protein
MKKKFMSLRGKSNSSQTLLLHQFTFLLAMKY